MDHDVAEVEAFIAAAAARGLRRVVLAWREEYGQHPDPAAIRYQRLRLTTLLAYDRAAGAILRCTVDGGDRAAIRARLVAAGLEVEERSRNTV